MNGSNFPSQDSPYKVLYKSHSTEILAWYSAEHLCVVIKVCVEGLIAKTSDGN